MNTTQTAATAADIFGEPISVYTRAQALEDGELVDVSERAKLEGFRVPVAVSRSTWHLIEEIPAHPKCTGQSVKARTEDMLWMAMQAARRSQGSDRIAFSWIMTTRENLRRSVERQVITRVLHIGPGDDGEPVITICTPEEL